MGRYEIVDDCLSPSPFVYLTYSGPNPIRVYTKITGMMQEFFEVSSSGIFEDKFYWDVSGSSVEFFIRMKVRRTLSRFTKMYVEMHVMGKRKKEVNKGKFTLRVNSYIETKFKYSNIFLRSLWWIYNYIFYYNVRRKYLDFCRNITNEFIEEIKEYFNLKIPEKVEWRE